MAFTAHPRIRGEHTPRIYSITARCGSSPHTRGAPDRPRGFPVAVRLIPAYAGSTHTHAGLEGAISAHPRIRGEHDTLVNSSNVVVYDSTVLENLAHFRLIPAYAGSTNLAARCLVITAAHPRIRGEHAESSGGFTRARGSSPHTRGARKHPIFHHAAVRLIPAYAGSTPWWLEPCGSLPAHPRIRGEHALVA